MNKFFLFYAVFPSLLFVGTSCGSEKGEKVQEDQQSTQETPDVASTLSIESMKVEAYPDAIIELYSPLGNENFKEGKVPFEFNIKNYPFNEGIKNFQFRLVINGNDPVSYHVPIFQKQLNTGTYRAVAYLIDQEGIALKEFGNYVDRDFTVGESQPFPESDEPYMVLNLPEDKQVYSNEDDVIVDFLLIGGGLKEDKLKFVLEMDGKQHAIQDLAPIKLQGLPIGEHDVKVMLVKENGDELEGVFTSVTRSINIKNLSQ